METIYLVNGASLTQISWNNKSNTSPLATQCKNNKAQRPKGDWALFIGKY
jgi:hypothetical protein